ncbi:MAG: alanyl-tRNA editing protein [Nitrososphaerales archaeon]
MRTARLYWIDPYISDFNAKVEYINGKEVVLDGTYFYPQGGGQIYDTGTISEIRVVKVRREGDLIIHTLESEPNFQVGSVVECKVDWSRRYKIMKLHSSAHLLYYAMQEEFGEECRPASPGLTDDVKSREDYIFKEKIDLQRLRRVEEKVNALIAANLNIHTWSEGETRYWKIEPYPPMLCGGTHPKKTGEIGAVKVSRGKKPGAGKERIEVTLLA